MDELSIFNEALERTDPAERTAYLAATCADDAALRERIERLLLAHARAGDFLSVERSPGAQISDAEFSAADGHSALTIPAEGNAASVPPAPGDHVRYFGDYEILDEIARGGMGVVFRARQRSLGRVVAIKMILVGKLAGDLELRRFHREAEAVAKLDHPGIVPIYEVGTHDGQPYFSMGYVEGYSLADARARAPRAPKEAAEWVRQVADAIEHAHASGIAHRDLKPGNILFDQRTGALKVTDFGLARCVHNQSELTVTGQILGTPGYMAPEQAKGQAVESGSAADIHALGAVLYYFLTGRPPFQADNPVDTLLQTINEEPVAPRALNPKVPRDLDTICLKCLQKDASRRYRSAADMAADLQRWLDGRPIHARPVSTLERSWRWVRRNPLTAALSGLCIATVLLLALVSSIAYLRTDRALAESEQRLYSNQLMLASRELDARHRNPALWLLKATAPARRGWEWRYLMRRCTPRQILLREGETPARVVWPADELSLLDDQGGLRRADSDARREPPVPFQLLEVSDDHRSALGVDPTDASRVRLLDLASGTITREWTVPAEQRLSVSLRADHKGILVAWADGLTMHLGVWNLDQDEPVQTGRHDATRFVGVDASRQWIVGDVVDGESVRRVVWDVDSGAKLLECRQEAKSFWGSRLLCQQVNAQSLLVRDLNGEYTAGLERPSDLFGIRESPTGQRLATLTSVRGIERESEIQVWKRPGLTLEHRFSFTGGIVDAAISRDGRWLAAAVAPLLGTGELLVWDLDSGELVQTLRPASDPEARPLLFFRELRFHPDGSQLALRLSAREERLRWIVWPDFLSPAAKRFDLPISDADALAISADGRRAVVHGFRDGKMHEVQLEPSPAGNSDAETSYAELVSAIQRRSPIHFGYDAPKKPYEIVAANGVRAVYELPVIVPMVGPVDNGKIELRGPNGELLGRLDGKMGLVTKLAFNQDGTRLATISADETAAGRASIFGLGVDWESDEFQQTAEIKMWSVPSGRLLWTARGHAGDVTDVAFSHDGRRMATSSMARFGGVYPAANQGEILVWDVESGQSLFQLTGAANGFSTVAFSHGGDWLAATAGNQLWVWDGREVESPAPTAPKGPTPTAIATNKNGAMTGATTGSTTTTTAPAGVASGLMRAWPADTRIVYLEARECTADSFRALDKLERLQHLIIQPDTIPSFEPRQSGVRLPLELPQVEQLTVFPPVRVDMSSLPVIARSTTLTRFAASSFPESADFSELARSKSLRELALAGTFTDASLGSLAAMSSLRSVRLEAPLSGDFLSDWRQLEQLESLAVKSPALVGSTLRGLAPFRQLKRLELDAANVDSADLAVLDDLPALESLALLNFAGDDATWPVLTRLTQLRSLKWTTPHNSRQTISLEQLRELPGTLSELQLGVPVVNERGDRLDPLVVLHDLLSRRSELDVQYQGERWRRQN